MVGAGVRRSEAAVGVGGFAYLARERDPVARIAEQLGAPRAELPEKIAGLLDRLKAADRENARLKQQATTARAADLADGAVDANGVQVVTATSDGGADASGPHPGLRFVGRVASADGPCDPPGDLRSGHRADSRGVRGGTVRRLPVFSKAAARVSRALSS